MTYPARSERARHLRLVRPVAPESLSVVVTGSRHWRDRERVWRVMDGLWRMTEGLVHVGVGDCPTGLDAHVRDYAQHHGVEHCITVYEADWDRWKFAAGPRRNRIMVNEMQPDLALAFFSPPPAENRGTQGCCDILKDWGCEPFPYYEDL